MAAFIRRAGRWTGVAIQFFSAHAVLQAATLATGLLFTNLLPVDVFAAYALASSILLAYSFLTDLGVSASLHHFRHESLQGQWSFEDVVVTITGLRRQLFLIGLPLAAVAVWLWGRKVGTGIVGTTAMWLILLGVVWWQMLAATRVIVLRLRGEFGRGYRAEIWGALARLLSAVVVLAVGWRDPWSATAVALVAAMVSAGLATGGEAVGGHARPEVRRAVLRYLAPSLPSALYYAVQGPVVIWFAAVFGEVATVAEVGALGRLGLIVGAFSSLTTVVFLPRLARIVDEALFLRRFLQFAACLVLVGLVLQVVAWAMPGAFLGLVGTAYRELGFELRLMVLASSLSLIAGYFVSVNQSRSWSRWQPGALLALVAFQAAMAATLPMGTTLGAMWFTVGSVVAAVLCQGLIAAVGFWRPSVVKW